MELDIQIKHFKEHLYNNSEVVILSYGMGVESTAILLRWIFEPETRPCSLDKLIVITAQTGNEWQDTAYDVEKYILPLMREYNIRFVQVARSGHIEADGITILEDSRCPSRCFIEGDYKLSKELLDAGTVPQYGGTHRCALKFKNFVIEHWLDKNVRVPARHVFGYNLDEKNRAKKSEDGFNECFKERIVFGFNSDEISRAKKGEKYDTANRVGYYPLIEEWHWNRADCLAYIKEKLGVVWNKSACVFCPFSHNKQTYSELISRQFEHPRQVAAAMLMEHISLSMNVRSTLYESGSLIEMVRINKNNFALQEYENILNCMPWAIYHVRRIFAKKSGMADRCVEKTFEYELKNIAESKLFEIPIGEAFTKWGIKYVFINQKISMPGIEDFWVAAPAVVQTKARYGVDKFDAKWESFKTVIKNKPQQDLFIA